MTRALLWKDLRELRHWVGLGLVLGLMDLWDAVSHDIDSSTLASQFRNLTDASLVFVFMLSFGVGTGLATRDEDEGTLGFLDGLPVTRTRIFFTRFGLAVLLLLTYPLVRASVAALQHVLGRGSLDHDVRWGLVLAAVGVAALVVTSGLALGAALGRLRSLTWLVAGALAAGVGWLTDEYPATEALNPLSVTEVRLEGLSLSVDGTALAAQVGLSVLMTLLAWVSFVRAGQPTRLDLSKRPWLSAFVAVLTVGSVVGAVAVWSEKSSSDAPPTSPKQLDDTEPQFSPGAPALVTTQHYRLSYRTAQAGAAQALADRADDVFVRVHHLLGVPPGKPIDIDASGSMRSTDGTAFLGGLRMRLGEQDEAVLAHETSHVVARRVAGEARAELWLRVPTLNEGLATWVERQFPGKDADAAQAQVDEAWFVLAVLHERRELLLEELVSVNGLARNRDERLKYTAGAVLVEALVDEGGPEAIPRLLQAFANERLPPTLSGLELWQATFQLAGLDFPHVVDTFFRRVEAHRDLLEEEDWLALPRPRVRLVTIDDWHGAVVDLDDKLPTGWDVVLRFRPSPDAEPSKYDFARVKKGEPEWRKASTIRLGRICVQAGLELPEGSVLYEPWACLPLDSATEWTWP